MSFSSTLAGKNFFWRFCRTDSPAIPAIPELPEQAVMAVRILRPMASPPVKRPILPAMAGHYRRQMAVTGGHGRSWPVMAAFFKKILSFGRPWPAITGGNAGITVRGSKQDIYRLVAICPDIWPLSGHMSGHKIRFKADWKCVTVTWPTGLVTWLNSIVCGVKSIKLFDCQNKNNLMYRYVRGIAYK